MKQDQFGFEDSNAPSTSPKSEIKKDIFFNLGYVNKRGEKLNLNTAISLEKKVNALQELLVEVIEECATEEEALETANEFLKKLVVNSVWIKSKQTTRKKLTLDDL